MKKTYALFFYIFCIITPVSLNAQTWKPVGLDENNNPSLTFSSFTNIVIAADGTPYIAYNDWAHDEKVSVKKFDGTKWVQVGQPGFSEGYYASDISLAFAPDGTPYVAYVPTISGQNYVTVNVRKLSENTWVDVGDYLGTGIAPSLTFTPDGTPYVAFSASYGFGNLNVVKFGTNWQRAGDTTDVAGSAINSSKIITAADGTLYIAYSPVGNHNKVSVKKFVSGNWQLVGNAGFSNKGASNVTMASASDGTLYVAYEDTTNGKKAMVQQYKNGKWSVTSGTGLSKGAATYLRLAVAPDLTPYLIFTDAGNNSMATVMKLNGSSWSNVGAGIISAAAADDDDIAVGSNGVPYVIYRDYSLYGKATVKKYNGNQWVDVGMGDASPGASTTVSIKTTKTGAIYTSFNDGLYGGRASVKQYIAGAWQYLGLPGISQGAAKGLNMDLAPDGTPYVIYQDSTQGFKATAKKYSGGTWVQVGANISTGGGVIFEKIAIAPDGTPFAAYSDEGYSGQLTVQKYSAGAWGTVGTPAFTNTSAENISIAIDQSNTPYVAYTDYGVQYANVVKFVGGSWVSVGPQNFISTGAKDLNMALAPDGTPYVAYYDPNKGKIAVQAYKNSSWAFVGGATASDSSGSVPKILFDQNGQLYLGFIEGSAGGDGIKAGVKKLSGGVWVDAGNKAITPWRGIDNAMAITPNGDLLYAYLNPQVFVRTLTSDNLAAPPVITACTPDFGGTGTIATITGFNFSKASVVKFGQTPAALFSVVSPTQIQAVVGLGATGKVSVTTSYGTGTYDSFTFSAAPPVITSFSPHFGNIGSIVTIKGKNLGTSVTANIVFFGAVKGQVISASDTVITVKVPAGSTYAPLSVTTRQLTAYTRLPFDVTFKAQTTINSSSFAVKVDYPSLPTPTGLLITDIDNDGKPDVVATKYGGGELSVYQNTSSKNNISLVSKSNMPGGGYALAGADFDGDGKIDIAYTQIPAITITDNTSTAGNFSFAGLENFQTQNYPFDISAGDIDGDGRPDIVTANNAALAVSILRNSSSAKNYVYLEDEIDLTPFDAFPQAITLADLDGDGKPEIITLTPNYNKFDGTGVIYIFKNTSTPHQISYTLVDQLFTAKNPQKPVVGDIDGDGKLDIIVPNSDVNTVTIFKNQTNSNIAFAAGVSFATGNQPNAVCIADLDGDRKPDIAVTNWKDNTVSVLKNTSTVNTISFAPKVDFKTGNAPYNVVAGDLDGDGAPELIVANNIDNTISVLHNTLLGFVLPQTNFTVAITSATCKGSNNGSINIAASQSLNYTAVISGNGLNNSIAFTATGAFNNLATGTYNVCITVAGESGFQQCYNAVIAEPKDLSLYSTINDANNTITLALSGGAQYNVQLNGVVHTTTDNTITLPLTEGNNELLVTTDKLCQGTIQKLINISGKITPYPVPFENTLNLNIGNTPINNVSIEIHDVSDGKLVYSKKYVNKSGVLQLDVSALTGGIYALHLSMDNSEKIFKITK